jgi:uncharacterized membrane protein (UPF0127 family)
MIATPDRRPRSLCEDDRMRRLLLVSFAAAIAMGCGGAHGCPDADSPGRIEFAGGDVLTVLIADEPDERAQGLMDVDHLPPDEGMAFMFETPQDAAFWMKDTRVPLSIAFLRGGRVVAIRDMDPCTADPCPTYASSEPYTLAIEANQGWFAGHGIAEGDRMERFDGPFCS